MCEHATEMCVCEVEERGRGEVGRGGRGGGGEGRGRRRYMYAPPLPNVHHSRVPVVEGARGMDYFQKGRGFNSRH